VFQCVAPNTAARAPGSGPTPSGLLTLRPVEDGMSSPPLLSVTLQAATPADQQRLDAGLRALMAEDPAISVKPDAASGGIVLGGMSDTHLEIVIDRLKREFGVSATVGRPQIGCKETVTHPAAGEMKYHAQTDDGPRYAHVKLRLYPARGYVFENEAAGGAIPSLFVQAVDAGIREALEYGVLTGYPVDDVRVVLEDGSYHDVDSSEKAFQIAGAMAFRDAFKRAGPMILEPIMRVEISVPEDDRVAVLTNLSSRRGHVQWGEQRDGQWILRARVPLSELFGYATDLRSRTQGRGTFTLTFDAYEFVDIPDQDDDGSCESPVGVPRRPRPTLREGSVSLPEPPWTDFND
jgi:elongation factor G